MKRTVIALLLGATLALAPTGGAAAAQEPAPAPDSPDSRRAAAPEHLREARAARRASAEEPGLDRDALRRDGRPGVERRRGRSARGLERGERRFERRGQRGDRRADRGLDRFDRRQARGTRGLDRREDRHDRRFGRAPRRGAERSRARGGACPECGPGRRP